MPLRYASSRPALLVLIAAAGCLRAQSGACAPDYRPRTDSSYWNGWGADDGNTRAQPAAMARGLDAASIRARLKLQWAFGIPGVKPALGQPAAVGGVLYFGSESGTIYAVDARTGCTFWTFPADAVVRTAITVAAIQSGRYALLFGDAKAQVYALDVPTRQLRWKTKVDEHPWARLTGAPKLWEGKLYVPVSSHEETAASTARGSIVALDEETGKVLWKTYTVPEGSSGGAVESSPAVDAARGLLYAATTDALLALDLRTGAVKWSRRLTANDQGPAAGQDHHDPGAAPVVYGRHVLVGRHSGELLALDPDRGGEVAWRALVGPAGMAAGERALYVPLAAAPGGGLLALDPATGRERWKSLPEPRAAQVSPATAIPGVVLAGDMAGRLRAHAAATGEVIWQTDTAREFATVNGVKGARGGSIYGTGPVVSERMVFVISGSGIQGDQPGNVLLAFGVD